MFKYLFSLVLVLASTSAFAGLPTCSSGTYFEPARGGEGLVLTITDGLVTGGVFTYDYAQAFTQNRVPVKTWYSLGPSANSPNLDKVTLSVFETKALSPANGPLVVQTTPVGVAEVKYVDTNTLLYSYNIGQLVFPTCDFGPLPSWCQRRDVVLVRAVPIVGECL